MKKQVLNLGFQNQAGLGIVDRPMIIVITPFIDNKASYRLYNLQKNQKNDKVNLAEPYWYSNTHYDVLCFMYGSKADKRPDILDLDDLHSILEYLDDHYHYTELVHVPYDIHLKVDAIYNIIKKGLFLNYHQLTEKYLEKPFIKYKHNYYQIPVSSVDANDSVYTQTTDPLIQFTEDNLTQEINNYLSHLKSPKEKVTDQILAMPIGGWCGVAEALKFLGLRKEAYPFDYIRSDLMLIVNLLEVDSFSRKQISEILFSKYPDAKIEFVHHNVENDSTRETFITRTMRFIERIKDSERPILFIRAANSALDLYTEIQQSRRLLSVVETNFHRKGDKLLLIANYQEIPTGKMTKLNDGQIIIWNAMGVNAWRVPNNWHLVTNLIKIIAHELHYFDHNSEINYKMPPDYKEKPAINKTIATEKSKALTKSKTSKLIVHLIGQEPLEFSCDERSPILKTLFKAFYDTENNSRKKGVLIHLQIKEDGNPQDIFLRSSQISRIEVSPSLNIEVLRSLNGISDYFILRYLQKTKNMIQIILVLCFSFIRVLYRLPSYLRSICLRKSKNIKQNNFALYFRLIGVYRRFQTIVSPKFPLWSSYVDKLVSKCPKIEYPRYGDEYVLIGGTCGLGHRLVRNAKIYHHARSMGYRAGVTWFPFTYFFKDSEELFSQPDDRQHGHRFGNEPGSISARECNPAKVKQNFSNIDSPVFLQFDLTDLSQQEVKDFHRRIFDEASRAYMVNFHLMLISRLRRQWVEKAERFLEGLQHRYLVGLHIRTGNGERGDFIEKSRQVDTQAILDSFLTELGNRPNANELLVLVASDDSRAYEYLKSSSRLNFIKFTNHLPERGVVTANWSSPEGSGLQDRPEQRIDSFFDSYMDMCLLGYAKDLYISAWSSFVVGSCIFNKLNAHDDGILNVYDAKSRLWVAC